MRFLTLLFVYLPIISTGLYAQTPTDYSLAQNWAARPGAYPAGLAAHLKDTSLHAKADVFYVYPTLNTKKSDKRWNVPLTDAEQQNKVLQTALAFQGSAFAEAGRFFAP
ncbi:MAG: hypothetical protein RL751_182, partial [Bacteroidota bacterium]